jgi:SAM-dependent methyltransferase
LEPIKLLQTASEEIKFLESNIKGLLASDKDVLNILEAGCGRAWPLELKGVRHTVTGIDLDKRALEIRKFERRDLDEIVLGDLRTADFADNRFDLIYSSYVLEHIKEADCVMNNLRRWLKPGGLLILRIPDRDSAYGFITRFAPFWFHVFYKKHFMGLKHAGKPGFGPYPTYHSALCSRGGIHRYCSDHNLTIRGEYGISELTRNEEKTTLTFSKIACFLSLGKLAWTHDGLVYLLQKTRG